MVGLVKQLYYCGSGFDVSDSQPYIYCLRNVGNRYPNPIPNGTRVPHWAYIDVVVSFTSLRFLPILYGVDDVPFDRNGPDG